MPKKNVVDTNNYIRKIFTKNSEWDPEVKQMKKKLKNSKKKKKEKIDTLKEKNKIMIQNWKIFNYILLII